MKYRHTIYARIKIPHTGAQDAHGDNAAQQALAALQPSNRVSVQISPPLRNLGSAADVPIWAFTAFVC
jgi:hypothetical protein